MSHAAARLQCGGYKQIPAPRPEAEPPTLSSAQPCLASAFKFRDCTRLAQPPLPVPDKRTKPTLGVSLWLWSLCCESPRDRWFKVGKLSEVTQLFLYQLLPETHFGGMGVEELYRPLGSSAPPGLPLTYYTAQQFL